MNITPTFDEISKLWIEPFSVLINCMVPVEWVYCDWYWWLGQSEAKHSDPECIALSSPTELVVGSRAEGFCIPRMFVSKSDLDESSEPLSEREYWQPDLDEMDVKEYLFQSRTKALCPIFTVHHAEDDPRYVKLRLTEEWKENHPRYKDTSFLHQSFMLPTGIGRSFQYFAPFCRRSTYEVHGPVRKICYDDELGNLSDLCSEDHANVFKYPTAWPEFAMEWLVRPRVNAWPSPELLQDIFESGCHLAPTGRGKRRGEPIGLLDYIKNPGSIACQSTSNDQEIKEDVMDETDWRMAFSAAENLLGQNVTPVQRHILVLLKMIKKSYLPEVICSYHLKNLLFWECEKQDQSFWREDVSAGCLLHILDRLKECLEKRCIPHYIMPQCNLLQYEDPGKLAEAATSVADVRRNILPKTISLLKRLTSLAYVSSFFHEGLDLDASLVKVQDCSLPEEKITELSRFLCSEFVRKCKEVISEMNRETNPSLQRHILVISYSYQTLLARTLCKLWCLDYSTKSTEQFISFIKDQVKELSLDEMFVTTALEFLTQRQNGRDPSLTIPETILMKNMKALQGDLASEAIQHQLRENELVCLLKDSELKALTNRVYERFNPDDQNKDDLVKAFNEELERFLAAKAHDETAEESGKKEDN